MGCRRVPAQRTAWPHAPALAAQQAADQHAGLRGEAHSPGLWGPVGHIASNRESMLLQAHAIMFALTALPAAAQGVLELSFSAAAGWRATDTHLQGTWPCRSRASSCCRHARSAQCLPAAAAASMPHPCCCFAARAAVPGASAAAGTARAPFAAACAGVAAVGPAVSGLQLQPAIPASMLSYHGGAAAVAAVRGPSACRSQPAAAQQAQHILKVNTSWLRNQTFSQL